MRDLKFALGMCLFVVGMVVGLALLAAGCGAESSDFEVKKLRVDGACFLIVYDTTGNRLGLDVENYPCPIAHMEPL